MSNSSLVSYIRISPNKTVNRNHKIDTITIHCVAGQCSVETLGDIFAPTSRKASANYGIGPDGRIGMYCEEKDRSWCTSSASNDNRAITIEVASDSTSPYAVRDAAYSSLIELLVDICKRNGIKQLLWKSDKSLIGQISQQNMTVHRWFANTDCPGDYLFNKHYQIAQEVNSRLNNTSTSQINVSYNVQITATNLNIRTGPGTNYSKNGVVTPGVHGIIAEAPGMGATKWGKLSSNEGWISLDYATKIQEEDEDMTQDKFNEMFKNAMTAYRQSLQDNDSGQWSQQARDWATKVGLFAGSGTTSQGEPNFMWEDLLTREQAAQLFYRFAQQNGMA